MSDNTDTSGSDPQRIRLDGNTCVRALGGAYGLLDARADLRPNPDIFAATLWRALVSETLLAANTSAGRGGACTQNAGYYACNIAN